MKSKTKWPWITLITLPFLFAGFILSPVSASERIPAVITIVPSSSSVESGSSITLTATLKDSQGKPLSGEAIEWSFATTTYTPGTDIGTLRPTRGVTDQQGQATTTYTAATPHIGVSIAASFAGNEFYESAREIRHVQVCQAAGDTAGNIEDTTGAPLWVWITLIILFVGSTFIERHLVRG